MDNFQHSINFSDFLNLFWTMLPKKGTFKMDWYLPSPKWMFVINALLLLLHVSVAKTLEPILWDKHIFERNGPDGYRIEANINDVVDIVCPRVNDTVPGDQAQYHKFTQVTKEGYEDCDLGGMTKTLLRCNRPFLENQLRLLFQEQTTYPGDPVFKHGRDYYFITTADGTISGIDQSRGGLCSSHHMKMIVHMNGESVPGVSTPTPPTRSRNWSSTTVLPVQRSSTTSPKTSARLSTTVKPTRRKPTNNKPNESGDNDTLMGDKDDGNNSSNHRFSSTLLLLCATIAFVRWI